METVFHSAYSRGHADHGWLKSYHSFSFAGYYDSEKVNFGALRVLNDDHVEGGMGFGKHPHENMEIVSIPLSGDLEHEDNMGHKQIIKSGDVQVMSAGTGIYHSEYNASAQEAVKFLQIWVIPNKQGVDPRYQQITLDQSGMNGNLVQILSPNPDDDGVWIHQNAWFHMGHLKKGQVTEYVLKNSENGVYTFLLDGEISIENQVLSSRDAVGVWETDKIKIDVKSDSQILLMEVPMN